MLKRLEKSLGIPPIEDIKELLQGETGARIMAILSRLEKLSKESSMIPQVVRLLELVQELDKSGALERLNQVLSQLPKGKQGTAMISGIRELLDRVEPQLALLRAFLVDEK